MDQTSLIQFLWTALPILRPALNRFTIHGFASATGPRPRPFSLWSPEPKPAGDVPGPITDYTSWPALTDRSFSGRHLGPALPADVEALPKDAPYDRVQKKWGDVTALFARPSGRSKLDRSSVLFAFFAQWFTDSVLRIDPRDRRKNTSNHDIDLCQIYGLNEKQTRCLRAMKGGKLKSQQLPDGEYPCYLFERHGSGYRIRHEFEGLITEEQVDEALKDFPPSRREKFYATGLERGNSSIGYVSISTLFLREHNRICDELASHNHWDDERLFQTARAINIVLLLRVLVEDYINHINGYPLFKLDHTFAERKGWYRPNWIALEFDLLYRWHSLVPDDLRLDGQRIPASEFRNNNALLEQVGIGSVLSGTSAQAAGRIGLGNTPDFLLGAEFQALKMARDFRLRSYNEYRVAFALPALRAFSELTPDLALQNELARLYGTVDKVEFLVGLFAEDRKPGALFGQLMTRMVAYDAFTHIFSNPLLSSRVYNEQTFSKRGLEIIADTHSLQALVDRHFPPPVTASLSVPPRSSVFRLRRPPAEVPDARAAE